MSTWLDEQNSERALAYRAASDTYWGDVQQLRAFQIALVVLLPTVLAVAAQFQPSFTLTADLLAFLLTIVDAAVIYPSIAKIRLKAASAQEIFDSIAYALPNAPIDYLDNEDRADIHAAANRQNEKRRARNRDWYSPQLGALPIEFGRLACILESIVWDGGMRTRYVRLLIGILIVSIVGVVIYSTIASISAPDLVTRVLYPLIPAIVWLTREIWDQREAGRRERKLREQLQKTWTTALTKHVKTATLESLALMHQWQMFAYRERTDPVPNILYTLTRDRHQVASHSAADDVVGEYNASPVAARVKSQDPSGT